MHPEIRNLLRRCATGGHWRDAAAIVLQPVRRRLYRARKALSRTAAVGSAANTAPAAERPPAFATAVHPVFCDSIRPEAAALPSGLFAEVDRQADGLVRLARDRRYRIEPDGALPGDPEDVHAYDRLYRLARYARAAAFGHPQALDGLARDWAEWQHRGPSPQTAFAYTAAERIASLVEALCWLDCGGAAAAFAVPWKERIWHDARFLAAHPEYSLGVHNHLLNDARGLFLAARALPEAPESGGWMELAFRLWDEYFPQLLLADGALAEQSSHYHLLLCRTALEYHLAANLCGRGIEAGLASRIHRMFQLAASLVREDGSLPRFGDSSPDATAGDLRGLLATAWRHGLLDEAPRDRAITPLTLYYCGHMFDLPPAPAAETRLYPDGGFAFLRAGRLEVAIHADPRPEMRAHGNAGRGSFEVVCEGALVIREPGSYLQPGDPQSAWSRSGAAHNVTCLDGLSPVVEHPHCPAWYSHGEGSWQHTSAGLAFASASFRRLAAGIRQTRTWHIDDAGRLRFEETIEGTRPVRFSSRLHLGPGSWMLERNPGPAHVVTLANGEFRLILHLTAAVEASLDPGSFFPEYGASKMCHVLHLSGSVALPYRWGFTGCSTHSGHAEYDRQRNTDTICAA
jgi:hypothetical protein